MRLIDSHDKDRRLCDNVFSSVRLHLDGNLLNEKTDLVYDLSARVCDSHNSHAGQSLHNYD